MIFIKNLVFIYENWVGMGREWSGMYLEVILVLESLLEKPFWASKAPKTNFSNFPRPSILSFPQKLSFWIAILKIHLVEYVRMDHTDHFSFR